MKSVLVIGASSGIGRALALEYARNAKAAGSELTIGIVARRQKELESLKAEIETTCGPTVKAVVGLVDISVDERDIFKQLTAIKQKMGVVPETVVVNSGVSNPGSTGDSLDEYLDSARVMLRVNVTGAIACSVWAVHEFKAALKEQAAEKKPQTEFRLVGVSSVVRYMAMPPLTMYATSKQAFDHFLENLRFEFKVDRVPIAINIVRPGAIDTAMARSSANDQAMRAAITTEQCAQSIYYRVHGPRGCVSRALYKIFVRPFAGPDPTVPVLPYVPMIAVMSILPDFIRAPMSRSIRSYTFK